MTLYLGSREHLDVLDDCLPLNMVRFNPRPKAVMVIPIYHDSEIAQYPKLTGPLDSRGTHYDRRPSPTSPLDSRSPAVLSKSPTHHQQPSPPKHKRRLGLFRKASSYSPPRKDRSPSRSRHRREHSVPPPQGIALYDGYQYAAPAAAAASTEGRGRSQSRHRRHRSSSTAVPLPGPHYYPQGSPYATTLDRGDRARPSNDPLVTHPPSYQVQATHSSHGHSPLSPTSPYYYSGTTSYGRPHGRPPGDPLGDNTAGYQVQATQPQGGIVGGHGGLAGGEHALASANALPSHYGGGGRPTSNYGTGYYGGGGHSKKIDQVGAAIPLAQALSHGTHPQQGQALDAYLQNYFKVLPPNPKWCASRCRGNKKAVCVSSSISSSRRSSGIGLWLTSRVDWDKLRGPAGRAERMCERCEAYEGFLDSYVLAPALTFPLPPLLVQPRLPTPASGFTHALTVASCLTPLSISSRPAT